MFYIIEVTDHTYEAGVALCNKIVREINRGAIISKEDLEYHLELAERVMVANTAIHQSVLSKENKRYGGNKGICEEVKRLCQERLDTAFSCESKVKNFDGMSREELIAYIKEMEGLDRKKEIEEQSRGKEEFKMKDPDAEGRISCDK